MQLHHHDQLQHLVLFWQPHDCKSVPASSVLMPNSASSFLVDILATLYRWRHHILLLVLLYNTIYYYYYCRFASQCLVPTGIGCIGCIAPTKYVVFTVLYTLISCDLHWQVWDLQKGSSCHWRHTACGFHQNPAPHPTRCSNDRSEWPYPVVVLIAHMSAGVHVFWQGRGTV